MKTTRFFVCAMAVLSVLIPFAPASAASDFPGRQLQVIVPSAPGGGMDRMIRQLVPFVEKRLGTSLVIKNLEGGAFAVGTVAAFQAPGDCTTLLSSYQPQHAFTYLVQSVPYNEDSFMPIASVEKADALIYVKPDARWKTMKDLVEDARANPGKIRVGVATVTDPSYFATRALEKAAGVTFNLVGYNGGAAFRNAYRGGEIEVGSDDTITSITVKDIARVLGAFTGNNDPLPAERNLLADESIPSINAELGLNIEASFANTGVVFVNRTCYTDYPDRYQTLMQAFLGALDDPEYRAVLRKTGEENKLYVVPGPEYDKIVRAENTALLPILNAEEGFVKK